MRQCPGRSTRFMIHLDKMRAGAFGLDRHGRGMRPHLKEGRIIRNRRRHSGERYQHEPCLQGCHDPIATLIPDRNALSDGGTETEYEKLT